MLRAATVGSSSRLCFSLEEWAEEGATGVAGLFPRLLPDELFYSAAARFQDQMQFRSTSAVREALFGLAGVTTVVDLPAHLQPFVDRLPPGEPYTAADLIRRHTLFPYYEPFVPPARAQAAFSAMCDGGSRGIHRLLVVRSAEGGEHPLAPHSVGVRSQEEAPQRANPLRRFFTCPERAGVRAKPAGERRSPRPARAGARAVGDRPRPPRPQRRSGGGFWPRGSPCAAPPR